jgi:transcriptional regulator with XRE-family HTH domain
MKISKSLKAYIEESSKSDSYWVEGAKIKFAIDLEARLRLAKMTYAALAQKLGTSAAYITKVFRGDANMTIESMVKLARATGSQLDIRIIESVSATERWNISQSPSVKTVGNLPTVASATILYFPENAANHDNYKAHDLEIAA